MQSEQKEALIIDAQSAVVLLSVSPPRRLTTQSWKLTEMTLVVVTLTILWEFAVFFSAAINDYITVLMIMTTVSGTITLITLCGLLFNSPENSISAYILGHHQSAAYAGIVSITFFTVCVTMTGLVSEITLQLHCKSGAPRSGLLAIYVSLLCFGIVLFPLSLPRPRELIGHTPHREFDDDDDAIVIVKRLPGSKRYRPFKDSGIAIEVSDPSLNGDGHLGVRIVLTGVKEFNERFPLRHPFDPFLQDGIAVEPIDMKGEDGPQIFRHLDGPTHWIQQPNQCGYIPDNCDPIPEYRAVQGYCLKLWKSAWLGAINRREVQVIHFFFVGAGVSFGVVFGLLWSILRFGKSGVGDLACICVGILNALSVIALVAFAVLWRTDKPAVRTGTEGIALLMVMSAVVVIACTEGDMFGSSRFDSQC